MSISYKVDDAVEEAFKKLNFRKLKALIMTLEKNPDRIVLQSEIPNDHTHQQILDELPKDSCRFILYNYSYKTNDNLVSDKIIFIVYTPQICSPNEKFKYSFGKGTFENQFSSISVTIQSDSVDDLTEEKLNHKVA